MTKIILDIWSAINKGLTVLNSFIMIILFQVTIPEKDRKGKEVKVPIAANIILLIVLVTLLTLAIRYYSRPGTPDIV